MAKKNEEVTLDLVIKEPKTFVDFLKKFTTIDQSVLLEIGVEDGEKKIFIKSATPSSTCVKIGDIPFTEVFKDAKIPNRIKIGLYNFEKFIKVLTLSKDSDVNFSLTYDINDKKECVGKSIMLVNTSDNFELFIVCAPQTIFANLNGQDLEAKVFNTEKAAFTFIMTREFFSKFTNYIALDANDAFSLSIKKGVLYFAGKTQKLPFPDDVEIIDNTIEVSVKKEYLKFLDDEVYSVFVKSNSVIFESNDSNIKLAVSAADEDVELPDDEIDDDDDLFDDDDDLFDDE